MYHNPQSQHQIISPDGQVIHHQLYISITLTGNPLHAMNVGNIMPDS